MDRKAEFLKQLSECHTEAEWNTVCDEVKAYTKTLPESQRSGDYPRWWFPAIIASGLSAIIRD